MRYNFNRPIIPVPQTGGRSVTPYPREAVPYRAARRPEGAELLAVTLEPDRLEKGAILELAEAIALEGRDPFDDGVGLGLGERLQDRA